MKKNLFALLALIIAFSFVGTNVFSQDSISPIGLKLQVIVKGGPAPSVTYVATMNPIIYSSVRPYVVVFYCNGEAVGKAEIDKTGRAIFMLDQKPGKYQAQAAIPDAPKPVKSNIVIYVVPIGLN